MNVVHNALYARQYARVAEEVGRGALCTLEYTIESSTEPPEDAAIIRMAIGIHWSA